jgi:hypothetical protein
VTCGEVQAIAEKILLQIPPRRINFAIGLTIYSCGFFVSREKYRPDLTRLSISAFKP